MKLIVDSWQCCKLMQYSINQVNSSIVLSGWLLWSIVIQWNLSIMVTLGPKDKVSLLFTLGYNY